MRGLNVLPKDNVNFSRGTHQCQVGHANRVRVRVQVVLPYLLVVRTAGWVHKKAARATRRRTQKGSARGCGARQGLKSRRCSGVSARVCPRASLTSTHDSLPAPGWILKRSPTGRWSQGVLGPPNGYAQGLPAYASKLEDASTARKYSRPGAKSRTQDGLVAPALQDGRARSTAATSFNRYRARSRSHSKCARDNIFGTHGHTALAHTDMLHKSLFTTSCNSTRRPTSNATPTSKCPDGRAGRLAAASSTEAPVVDAPPTLLSSSTSHVYLCALNTLPMPSLPRRLKALVRLAISRAFRRRGPGIDFPFAPHMHT